MSNQAGKGSRPRPVNFAARDAFYERLAESKRKAEAEKQRVDEKPRG